MRRVIKLVPLKAHDASLTLIFDGRCGVCSRAAGWVRAHDLRGRVRLVPCQQRPAVGALGIALADCERQVIAIADGGRIYRGAAAVNRVLRELGGPWQTTGRALGFAPLFAAERLAYRLVAANRGRLSFLGSQPECDKPDAGCE